MQAVLVPGFNPGPYTESGTNTWLLPGRVPALIDAGTGEPRHLDALDQALAPGVTLSRVLVTHAHSDHAGGCVAIAARWPEAAMLKAPWPARDGRYRVQWTSLRDGDRIEAGDAVLVAVQTPGHAPDHLCFWDPVSRTIFTGDLLLSGGTVMIPASGGGDLAQYLASLTRVKALGPARALPGHGPVIEDPCRLIETYLEHRCRREEQVLEGLERGVASPDMLVARIYEGLMPDLQGAARESVLAHLVKLEGEGRVTRDEAGRWRLA